MAISPTYPGVYVREEASGARAIGGVATSIAAFVGMADRGPVDVPTRALSLSEYERTFGVTSSGELGAQVRQFFLNGGGVAWVMRIADGAARASVTLRNFADDADSMVVTARDAGRLGNQLRVEIDYATAHPEETFNLRVYRSIVAANGRLTRVEGEEYLGLSMRLGAPNDVRAKINGQSRLITVAPETPTDAAGVSMASRILPADSDEAVEELGALVVGGTNALRLQVANHPPVAVLLTPAAEAGTSLDEVAEQWAQDMNASLLNSAVAASVTVEITDPGVASGGVVDGRLIVVRSDDGSVCVMAAASADVTAVLGLGSAAGGFEGSSHGDLRPAPSGLVTKLGKSSETFRELRTFAGLEREDVTGYELSNPTALATLFEDSWGVGLGAGRLFESGATRNFANVRAVLETIAGKIAATASPHWTAKVHGAQLVLRTTNAAAPANFGNDVALELTGAGSHAGNVNAYTVGKPGGTAGPAPFQVGAVLGTDGGVPKSADYDRAYAILEREVPLFNLLLLPRADEQDDDARQELWGAASAFCAKKRAFLIVDPRSDWSELRDAEKGVDTIRNGLETRNAACYWPRVRVADGTRQGRTIDPCGSIAGLMARIDSTRGVWKAPAGLEATIRGVLGLERRITDDENGVINPRALNALRVFGAGTVSWGARTLVGFDDSGNVDDKYIPVRRTMLFIEESLYRGLQFAVFEPNDEPLWAQIRLAAGSFMNGLFRQGAFAGRTKADAYFVACDASTTDQNDINLGIVNVVVGFAPLKPAEFVILTVKQIAGQADV